MTLDQIKEATKIAHELVVYEESEKADLKDLDNEFDALWQSIYDVCSLIKFGVIEDITTEELEEGLVWLKTTQILTKRYKDVIIEI